MTKRTYRLGELFPKLPTLPDGQEQCRYCLQPSLWKNYCTENCRQLAYFEAGYGNMRGVLLRQRDRGICALCQIDTKLPDSPPPEYDHITPLAEEGTNKIENFRTLCRACHLKETALLRKRLAEARQIKKYVQLDKEKA